MPSESIYRLREQIEDKDQTQSGGLNALLTNAGLSVYTRINAVGEWYKKRPRVELKASVGAATGHRFVCPDGVLRFDQFHFALGFQVVTEPRNIPANNIQHEQMIGTVRNLMSAVGGQQSMDDLANFPGIYIAEKLKDGGVSDSSVDESEGLEYTTLSYEGIVCIRQTAFN
jgi:hypothetical protein